MQSSLNPMKNSDKKVHRMKTQREDQSKYKDDHQRKERREQKRDYASY